MAKRSYHHGDLRRALLDATAEAIGEAGPAALSLRDLARRAGVSHAAPMHHFGDKAGLLTAFAAEGFDKLSAELSAGSGEFLEAGVAYVRFALAHRAHFEVMFSPGLYRAEDADLAAARQRARRALYEGLAAMRARPDPARPDPARPDPARPDPARPDPGRTVGGSAGEWDETRAAGLAAWSVAHGFATLWLSGALPGTSAAPEDAARLVFARLRDGVG
ncbi:TetR/AcrR family transcriptional regulator [Mangrovihabitans endophyticus]|uniref:TetR family transcriptional regulator n=1 Tax=Mangrovihabitans endophyticus TaxID=1751298 RepID=A0A8J3C2B5_9ACTN|nr:TetR/AcrR family transcriptional regulator [Mangrovihabitans endophyticus]GGL08649.1 TetR family transcriptional regulator [Mangrovihabitans endophyticus]